LGFKKVFIKPFHHGIGKNGICRDINEYAIKPEYYTVRYLFMAFRRYPL
jgi:hypothetical protein